jgi:N-acetyl-anhydromuramyl-L-alanine amidase AmpD
MSDPRTYLFDLPIAGRPAPFMMPVEWYPGVQDYWSQGSSTRSVDPIEGIRAVVVHAAIGVDSAGAMSFMKARRASWHWLIPDESESQHGHTIWACTQEARAAWHVAETGSHAMANGGRCGVNEWSLGIEIINSRRPDMIDPFSEWQVEIAASLVRSCWAKYPNLTQVMSHALLEPEQRSDPGAHFPWTRFRDLVLGGSTAGSRHPLAAAAIPMGELPPTDDIASCCADPAEPPADFSDGRIFS